MAEIAVKASLGSLGILSSILAQEVSLLWGLPHEAQEIKLELESIISFLREADRKKESNEVVKTWVEQVRDVAYDVEDIIDKFMYRLHKQRRGGFTGFLRYTIRLPKDLIIRHQLATRLQLLKSRIESISVRRNRFPVDLKEEGTSSCEAREAYQRQPKIHLLLGEDQIVGIQKKVDSIVGMLEDEDPRRMVISVTGMGGLGKTTLVTKAYESKPVQNNFDCHACVSVSQSPRMRELLRSLIDQLFKARKENDAVPNNIESMDLPTLFRTIRSYLQSKRYVVVLDDVWNINDWNELSVAFPDCRCRSRIMITTRLVRVASALGDGSRHYPLESLNSKDAWDLFCKEEFWKEPCPPELQPLAQKFVEKCEGLPLAIVAMRGLLASDDRKTLLEWENIYNSLSWELSNNEMLKNINTILFLSFHDLPYYLKNCFLYFSIFPEDHLIHRKKLIRLWIAEGFVEPRKGMTMEDVAEDNLKQLIHRSMIQLETNDYGRVKTCRIHDLMHELALSKSKEEKFSMAFTGEQEASLDAKIRRLSICKRGESFQSSISMKHIRSFHIFDDNMPSSSSLHTIFSSFKLLRVLDLEGIAIESVPGDLTDLFNLRYLNLRNTNVKKLPKSLGRLKNLQTLDVRNTQMKKLPNGIVKLEKLRHLYFYRRHVHFYESFNYFNPIRVPNGLCYLKELRSLSVVEANEKILRQVGNLNQLRRFGIHKLKAVDGENLCHAISKMDHLLNLTVRSSHDHEIIKLDTLLRPPHHLQKIGLYGCLDKVPLWFSPHSLKNLTHLRLHYSQLTEDPLSSLQNLPNLVFLVLFKAYDGEQLIFDDQSFPRLKKLFLHTLLQLREVKIKRGAMKSIQELYLLHCNELKMVPEGIEHFSGLQQLYLVDMPTELVERMQIDSGKDRPRVQHIPKIKHTYMRGGKLFVDRLS